MNIYFFRNLPANHRAAFRKSYTLQNLKAVQTVCIIFFALNLLLRLFYTLVPNSVTHASNYPEFNYTNWAYLLLTPLFYLLGWRLLKLFEKHQRATGVMMAFVVVFSLYLLLSGILASFISTYNPRDNLTLYLVVLITVSVFAVFEYEDTFMITIVTELVFTVVLFCCEGDPTEVVYSQLTSIILLCGFFFISRYVYSYKASHFLQLDEIRRKNLEIEKASDFKNDVLGIVAHDLRNPIAAIESITRIMQLDELDDETEDNLSLIKASCSKALSIVNDLLEVAKTESDTVFETQLISLNEVLQQNINVWQNTGSAHRITLKMPETTVHVWLNVDKFNRVLDNLISNAQKFSKEKDKLDVILTVEGSKVLVLVRDYGVGIPANMLPHIFDRFTKAGRSGLKGEQSTGLGLSIAKQIIEKHNGSLTVESEEGRGSTFIISLPLAG